MDEIDFIIERSILKIGNRLANRRNDDLKKFDLTSFQSEALLFFDSHEKSRILDLKNHLKISHQAARNLVERLRQKGLISIQVSSSDGRAKNVFLTEKGKDICTKLKKQGGFVGKELLADFADSDKEKLLDYLNMIIGGL